jgi:hypothetical protein
MVAFEQECAAMDSRWDQAPGSSVLAERVVYIEAVMRATAVADAAEGRIHSDPGASQVLLSVGDKYRRWGLGCCLAVLEVAAD